WKRTIDGLSKQDLIYLIKALTMAEKEIPRWNAGSVSPVIRLFRKLLDVYPEDSNRIASWVLAHRVNEYLPWGTMRTDAETVEEFREFERWLNAQYFQRQTVVASEQEARERNREKRSRNLFVAISSGDIEGVK